MRLCNKNWMQIQRAPPAPSRHTDQHTHPKSQEDFKNCDDLTPLRDFLDEVNEKFRCDIPEEDMDSISHIMGENGMPNLPYELAVSNLRLACHHSYLHMIFRLWCRP